MNDKVIDKKIYDTTFKNATSIFYRDSKLIISTSDKSELFQITDNGITKIHSNNEIKKVYQWLREEGKLFALGSPGTVYEISLDNDKLNTVSSFALDFSPQTFSYGNNKIYFTYVEQSKLTSIWDPLVPSNAVRFTLWEIGWEIFKDHPIFGVGDIHLQKYHVQYKKPYDKEIHGHLHNNFIHVLATLGIFGLAAVCFMIVKMFIINYKIYRRNEDKKFISSYSLGVLGAFTAFLVAGLTEMNIWDHEIITLVYFSIGLNLAFDRH
jgi:hypothetical protein